METSKETKNLDKALLAVQAKLKSVPKTKTAKVRTKSGAEFEYKYADLSDCLGLLRPLLSEAGLLLLQPSEISLDSQDNPVMLVTTRIVHAESGEYIEECLGLPIINSGHMSEIQEIGSVITYGRRYGLGLLGLDTEEDDDGRRGGMREEVETGGNGQKVSGDYKALRDRLEKTMADPRFNDVQRKQVLGLAEKIKPTDTISLGNLLKIWDAKQKELVGTPVPSPDQQKASGNMSPEQIKEAVQGEFLPLPPETESDA